MGVAVNSGGGNDGESDIVTEMLGVHDAPSPDVVD
jgi:hypothetical protein